MSKSGALIVGEGDAKRRVAILRRDGKNPGLFWLGGFKSDMTGSKACAIDALGTTLGVQVTRFDYSGHGASSGDFLDGSISQWLEDALAVFDTTKGRQIIVGSSMGGWLALLLNKALLARNDQRVHALVLIAPAVDMTEDLMRTHFSPQELHDLHALGRVEQASDYSDEPYVLTQKLIQDGALHLLFGKGAIRTDCPVTILQGGQDTDIPPSHALKLLSHLTSDPVVFTLIPDGDHSLSRAQDLAHLEGVLTRLVMGTLA